MKKITSLILALLMTASLAVTVFANADGNKWGDIPLYKGEIKLDGKIDEIYSQGLTVKLDKATSGTPKATGVAYLLWGNNKLYMAAEVTDPEIVPVDTTKNIYENEAIEYIVDLLNNGSTKNAYKVMVSAQDNRLDFRYVASAKNAQSACTMTKTGYIVEVVYDLAEAALVAPKAGVNLGINIVIDDITGKDTRNSVGPTHKNNPGTNDTKKYDYATLSDKEVKVEATTKPAETTKPAAQTQKPAVTPAAPATFDAVTVIAVVAAASLGGVVVSKKRK